jgi:hypothetical protein
MFYLAKIRTRASRVKGLFDYHWGLLWKAETQKVLFLKRPKDTLGRNGYQNSTFWTYWPFGRLFWT